MSSVGQLSTLRPQDPCDCGELPVLVVEYHSGWGDFIERACPWCFGGSNPPRRVHGIWFDDEYRTGTPEHVLDLFIAAYRRAARRRMPDVARRSHDDSVALWDVLSRRHRWDETVVVIWMSMMRDPLLTVDVAVGLVTPEAHADRSPHAWEPLAQTASFRALAAGRARLVQLLAELQTVGQGGPLRADAAADQELRDARSIAVAAGTPFEWADLAEAAWDRLVGPTEGRPNLLQSAKRVAEIWELDAVENAREVLVHADAVLRRPGLVTESQVVEARIALKQSSGRILVLLTPPRVRPLVLLWYSDEVRAALEEGDRRRTLELLPDERAVLTMAEHLLDRPPT